MPRLNCASSVPLPTGRDIARATLRHGYQGRVVAGHCCSLAFQSPEDLAITLALAAEARPGLFAPYLRCGNF